MTRLKTIYSSNIPVNCHILKGRLETEGINCFIYDENMVWVHPFKAVAVGGVKIKVPEDQQEKAANTIALQQTQQLSDENGVYSLSEVFQDELIKQNEILRIKSAIRKNPKLLNMPEQLKTEILSEDELAVLIESEIEFNRLSKKRLNFDWKDFWYELLDFDRSVFSYLRIRPVEYYLDKELVEKYNDTSDTDSHDSCPECHSTNVVFGYAIDIKWDILYLVLSLLTAPLWPIRKKMHCFNCGLDFKQNDHQH
ncbi:DUF2007 domain-containing protein [Maribellus sediminis]|uniref:putative signal transducing protein n=1 Tax=Maribellus sediminis TaxID=2696285 RepID=UPI001430EC52|nr:DUF2007 domain-containing protein [Maribellus sediminis]